MKQLMAIEWLKIKKYRTFWTIMLLFGACVLLWNLGVTTGVLRLGGDGINLLGSSNSFGGIWDTVTYYTSNFVLVPAIFIIIGITNEYQFRTNRQNVIDGWTRLQFFHAKWYMMKSLALTVTLFVAVMGLVIGLITGASFAYIGDNIEKLVYMLILCANYFGFALMISVFVKRSGLAIGILMLYCMIIEMMLHFFFLFKLKLPFLDLLLPLQSSDELLPSSTFNALLKTGKFGYQPPTLTYAIVSCIWICIYYLIARRRLMRSDW
ncbi:ABC-2 transporter permease [Taibaiella soli]|uniref:Uncharacterized protein n=1 Tax=Taibaiella soli TaxID=1649169 RepID=A0A2W2AH98_9BACT|nr:ABC transporter permease [Taibaiella soli]PZF74651.1 hypothetical protein DN068_03475 [Taibaiella soli]